jgi:hypothetical protein
MNETTNSTKTGEFSTTSFRCSVCKKVHEHSPLNYAARVPHSVLDVPESDRQSRVYLTNDQCVIDNRKFFLRGRVAIRIIDQPKPLIWGVWARVRQSDFKRAIELSTSEGREVEPAYRGLLDTELMIYGHTLNLEVLVNTQPVGMKPIFDIVSTTHILGIEQREGVSLERLREIDECFIHPRLGW